MTNDTKRSVVLAHRRPDGQMEILLAGHLDINCVGRLRDAVMSATYNGRERVVVDASRITDVDSVGLRTLVACRRLAVAAGVQLVLDRPSPSLLARLASTGLLRTFTVTGEVSDHGNPLPHMRQTASAR